MEEMPRPLPCVFGERLVLGEQESAVTFKRTQKTQGKELPKNKRAGGPRLFLAVSALRILRDLGKVMDALRNVRNSFSSISPRPSRSRPVIHTVYYNSYRKRDYYFMWTYVLVCVHDYDDENAITVINNCY